MTVTDIKLSPVNEIAEKALKELGVHKRDTNGNTQFGGSNRRTTYDIISVCCHWFMYLFIYPIAIFHIDISFFIFFTL